MSFGVTRVNIIIGDLVSNRSSFELCRRFHTFNTRFVNVVVPIRMRIAADQVINIITITGDTPVDRSRQAFKAPFPLFTLLRFKVRIAVRSAVDLAHRRCFKSGAVRGNYAITIHKLPRCAGLPRAMVAKVGVVVITRRRFQRHAVELLHRRREHAGITLLVTFFQVTGPGLRLLLLPVQACTDIAMADFYSVEPLGGVLLHVIHGCGISVAPFLRIIVLIFTAAVTRHQL